MDWGAGQYETIAQQLLPAAAAAIARASGDGDRPPPFPWHDQAAVAKLFAPYGFKVDHCERTLAFTAESPEAFAAAEFEHQPIWVAARAALDGAQMREVTERRVSAILHDANEHPDRFRVTSRYLVFTVAAP